MVRRSFVQRKTGLPECGPVKQIEPFYDLRYRMRALFPTASPLFADSCLVMAVVLALLLAAPVRAQVEAPPGTFFYLGGGTLPGFGGVVTYSTSEFLVLTQEASLYVDYTPRLVGGRGRLLVGAGFGGSVRVLRLLGEVTGFEHGRYDLDTGLRFGPSFFFSFFEQTAASKARAYSLFLDPFARGSLQLANGRTLFGEIGRQPPHLRGGLVFMW
jgi:hypothetical protein